MCKPNSVAIAVFMLLANWSVAIAQTQVDQGNEPECYLCVECGRCPLSEAPAPPVTSVTKPPPQNASASSAHEPKPAPPINTPPAR